MDRKTARQRIEDHLSLLREMGFLCLEGQNRPASIGGVASPSTELIDEEKADSPLPALEPPKVEKKQEVPSPAAVPVASVSPPSQPPREPSRPTGMQEGAQFPLEADNWPESLFTVPVKADLTVVHPPFQSPASIVSVEEETPEAEVLDLFQSAPTTPVVQEKKETPIEPPTSKPVERSREERIEALSAIAREVAECNRCGLYSSRTHVVPGQGNPMARIAFVGEGPGHNEDLQGAAFVGRAGQLLTDIIHAMQLTRDDVFICNVVKCRPPENRNPHPDEMAACEPFLKRQLEILQPAVIIALGGVALKCLLQSPDLAITRIRGKWQRYQGIPLMPTFHPAYLLRSPGGKRSVWDDVQKVMAVFGIEPGHEKKGGTAKP